MEESLASVAGGWTKVRADQCEFWFQILLYCVLRNGTKIWILKPAREQTSAASKDHVLSYHNQVPSVSGKGDFTFTVQGDTGYRIGSENKSFPKCPQSFLFFFPFFLKDLNTKCINQCYFNFSNDFLSKLFVEYNKHKEKYVNQICSLIFYKMNASINQQKIKSF